MFEEKLEEIAALEHALQSAEGGGGGGGDGEAKLRKELAALTASHTKVGTPVHSHIPRKHTPLIYIRSHLRACTFFTCSSRESTRVW